MNNILSKKGYAATYAKRYIQFALIVGWCMAFAYACSAPPDTTLPVEPTRPEANQMEIATMAADYSSFTHSNPMHVRLPCLLCHTRDDNSPMPKLSGHLPCSGCHVQQFADKNNQICSICHTNISTGTMKPFPPLRGFNAMFDHRKHLQQTNCATCHRPSQNGVAFSIPSGSTAHNTCFQCHAPDTQVNGKNIGSCSVCHQPGEPPKTSEWAKAFTYNFSHVEHKGRGNLNCTSCHTVQAGASRGNQVTGPVTAMHFAPARSQSCGGCHNSKRAFGIENFTNCKRCHEGKNFKF